MVGVQGGREDCFMSSRLPAVLPPDVASGMVLLIPCEQSSIGMPATPAYVLMRAQTPPYNTMRSTSVSFHNMLKTLAQTPNKKQLEACRYTLSEASLDRCIALFDPHAPPWVAGYPCAGALVGAGLGPQATASCGPSQRCRSRRPPLS